MSGKRDLHRLLRRLNDLDGWTVTRSGNGHHRIAGPGTLMFCPHSPSDHRALPNLRARLRRSGVPGWVLGGRRRSSDA